MTSLIFIILITIIVVLLAIKLSHGKLLLFKTIQDYGYSDFRTIGVLNEIVKLKLNKNAESNSFHERVANVSLFHEYGNVYKGTVEVDTGADLSITVKTDGFRIYYKVE